MEQISNPDREEDIPATLTRSLIDVPCITESEMRRRGQLDTNPFARAVTRTAERSITRADPRHVKHEHRTDRIDVHIFEERVQSAARESHVVPGLLRRRFCIDLIELRR